MFTKILAAFYRLFFRLLYHELAFTYNWVADIVSVGRWQQWIFTTLPFLNGPRVLELGHGPGHLFTELSNRGVQVIGLDASAQMGRLAYSSVSRKGLKPVLVNGYAQSLPFIDGAFDQVAATFPTEYILQPSTLQEIGRVLAPHGRLIVLPVAWITGKGIFDRAAAWLFRVTGQAPQWDPHAVEPLQANGFQVEVHNIQLDSSEVLIIQAAKDGNLRAPFGSETENLLDDTPR